MGMDIYSGRGIVFTVEEFLKVINGKSKADVVAVCRTFYDEIQEYADSENQWKRNLAERYKILSTLNPSMKLCEIRDIINSTVKIDGEVAKYGSCWVEDSEYVESLFNRILDVCPHADNLPHIAEVTAWGSGRNNGWDVPKGVACVVFDSESCFERTLSDQGKAVKKLFGHCDETEWTEMSV